MYVYCVPAKDLTNLCSFPYVVNMAGELRKVSGDIKFLEEFELDKREELNGLILNELYLPKELLLEILSNLSSQDVIKCSLVCKTWFNLTRSTALWKSIYFKQEQRKKVRNLPWYVFYCHLSSDYFRNVIKNGNGELHFKHWQILQNKGDKFGVEKVPTGCDLLPADIPEFHGKTSCFVTSYEYCSKYQKFDLSSKRLLSYIIQKYRPILYASEWYTGRFDCSCSYDLLLACERTSEKWEPKKLIKNRHSFFPANRTLPSSIGWPYQKSVSGSAGLDHTHWEKKEIFYEDYPDDLTCIIFIHGGKDAQFWKGRYGSKMAGGTLKFVFESIQPPPDDFSAEEL
uniref:F-box domain-containing protein n=1 Tax=Dendroctonus ponderosae TaxID=77166 RepID=J3JX85_DENPD|nr:unknown [Dendroctonus ponderosae]